MTGELPGELRSIPLGAIVESPTNPRKYYDPKALAELTESLRTKPLIHPVTVRPQGDRFELVVGSRRYRATTAAAAQAKAKPAKKVTA
ncbi:MAG: ParB N-terminal domain-containing protein [Myxococcales bacterium]|nr:ParB N-terminal domain-containing protein [Myxococcales bacterium]